VYSSVRQLIIEGKDSVLPVFLEYFGINSRRVSKSIDAVLLTYSTYYSRSIFCKMSENAMVIY